MATRSPLTPKWKRYKTYDAAAPCAKCLYVFWHPDDPERPFYVGKAKRFGGTGARYNQGYSYLVKGLLKYGYQLYIACLTDAQFQDVEGYELMLIKAWKPRHNSRLRRTTPLPIDTAHPW